MKNVSPLAISLVCILIGGGIVVASNSPLFHPGRIVLEDPLDLSIQKGEAALHVAASSTHPYLSLAGLYLQKARQYSDATYYEKIEALMDSAEAIDPKDADIFSARASVAMGRHDFKSGYSFATRAITLNPTRAAYYGLRGDAEIELGQYSQAEASIQKMIDIRPDFSSWSRVAYIRELNGDIPGAKVALTNAIQSGSSYAENIAWAHVELGKLHMRDDLVAAKKDFEDALVVMPTYTQAKEGLGKVAFFENDDVEAERQFTAAYNILPLAQYAVDLGDLYDQQKNATKASQEYALAEVAFHTSIKGGVNTDLEQSLFLSDHNLDMTMALEMAMRAYTARPNIYAADYLSWVLYKTGKVVEAQRYTAEALRLGKNDALILFHQGEIALANGDQMKAKEYLTKAAAINPNFSMQYAAQLKYDLQSIQ